MIRTGTSYRKFAAVGVFCICTAAASPLTRVAHGAPEDLVPVAVKPDRDAERRHKAATVGLDYLAGHLPIVAQGAAPAKNPHGHETAIVSLCGLAFLASGSDLKAGPYHGQLQSCLDAVLADCQETGLIASAAATPAPMYDHSYAVLFFAETYARTHDARIKPKLEKAVALLNQSQSAEGGWRYVPMPRDADVSVTASALNALLAAKAAGIDVPAATIKNALAYLVACQNPDGGFTYTHAPNANSGPARSAAAAAALQHAGGQIKEVDDAITYLDGMLAAKPGVEMAHSAYTHYYASQLLASNGAKKAQPLLDKMCVDIIAAQQADGSWHGASISPEYDTACSVIALEAPDGGLWIFGAGAAK